MQIGCEGYANSLRRLCGPCLLAGKLCGVGGGVGWSYFKNVVQPQSFVWVLTLSVHTSSLFSAHICQVTLKHLSDPSEVLSQTLGQLLKIHPLSTQNRITFGWDLIIFLLKSPCKNRILFCWAADQEPRNLIFCTQPYFTQLERRPQQKWKMTSKKRKRT